MPGFEPKDLRPGRRRQLVDEVRGAWKVSIRRACRVLRTDTTTYHYKGRRVAFDVGFSDLSYFNRTFRKRYNSTPTDVRLLGMANDRALGRG
jgi:AraC-like DNA-binding protein